MALTVHPEKHTADQEAVVSLLQKWITPLVDKQGLVWLDEKAGAIARGGENWVFFTSFSAAPRYTGKADLNLDLRALRAADEVRPHWNPAHWSVDQATRSLMLLAVPARDPDAYLATLDKVFNAADVGESVVLYQTLPLYPLPNRFIDRAAEGLRSNMTSVFEAVALRNPYPAEYFGENTWNQMVLKSCFVGSPLREIWGLDERANPNLARMLVDYAHERWAAGRTLTSELWRPVGPFAADDVLPDLERVLNDPDPIQQQAGALALAQSPASGARDLLATRPDLNERIAAGALTWNELA
jgi:hypothetical protein